MPLLDMVNKVLNDTGLGGTIDTVSEVDSMSDEGKVIKWIQDAQRDVARDVPNAPLMYYGNITTVDDITDTVSVTNGSPTITTTAATSAWVGRLFYVKGDSQFYRVLKVGSATSITLGDPTGAKMNYRGTTATGATAYIAQDRYLLPANYKSPITVQDFFTTGLMEYKSPEEYDSWIFQEGNAGFLTGSPRVFTIFSTLIEKGVPRYYVEFRPIPDDVYHYPFRYSGEPKIMKHDNDVSGFPELYEVAILHKAKSYVYRYAMQSGDLAGIEERDYNKVINKQQSNPVQGRHTFQLHPQTGRDHWGSAYR